MFSGCTSLITAPELPATTLAHFCYESMFRGCTSLVTAPELPARKLEHSCYKSMFNGCSKLKYIKMLAADISATDCLTNWVSDVAYSGEFYKKTDLTSIQRGVNGIPNNWVVYYANCVSPSIINTLYPNVNVNFDHNTGKYSPTLNNIDLSKYGYDKEELLSMKPDCNLSVDIVYMGKTIKEDCDWKNGDSLNSILTNLKVLDENYNINEIIIIIVKIEEPEDSGYYYYYYDKYSS
jgi:hypothetical protein